MADLSSRIRTAAGQPVATGKAVIEQVREDDVPFMAGSIAYQAFVSLIPLLILLFFVVTFVGNEALANQVTTMTEGFLPSAAQSLLSDAIAGEGGTGSAGATVIGAVTLVWGSLKIFRGLDTAFSEIYKTNEENSFVDTLSDAVVVLVVLVVSILAMVTVGSIFAVFEGLLARALNLFSLVAGLTVAFLPIYRYFPDADLSWADAVPGAVFAAFGWGVLQFLFQFYVAVSSKGASSAIGAVLLLLTWLYLGGLVLLLGGVVNAVLLGKGDPSPQISEDDQRLQQCTEKFHRERDRRQSLQHEAARYERRLVEAQAAPPSPGVATLRDQNHLLTRRLRWAEKSLPARLLLRLLGKKPAVVRADPAERPASRSATDQLRTSWPDYRAGSRPARDDGRSE